MTMEHDQNPSDGPSQPTGQPSGYGGGGGGGGGGYGGSGGGGEGGRGGGGGGYRGGGGGGGGGGGRGRGRRDDRGGQGYGGGRDGGGRDGGGREGGGGGGGRFERGHDEDGRGLPLSELDPALTEISRKLIGCAIEVHKGLGPGYDKSSYQKALEVELNAAGVEYAAQKSFPVVYRGQTIGSKVADLYVGGRFVVEVLAQRGEIGAGERAGVRALLRAGDMELGLIINFAERRLKDGLIRVLNPEKLGLNHSTTEPSHEEPAPPTH